MASLGSNHEMGIDFCEKYQFSFDKQMGILRKFEKQ
jgi:hypothetical protein